MATFIVSSFGVFVMSLFAGLFTAPSWQTFLVLAYGWAVAGGERQTITTYLWLTGATRVKHFSCYYRFLGGALYQARWHLWARIIRGAARWVPEGVPIILHVDDSTKKKAGRQIEGVGHYRNGAGSARQEYRTLRGLNFVWGQMRVPVPGWPGQQVSVPIGLSLYLKAEQARKLNVPYQTRSAWRGKSWTLSRPNSRRGGFGSSGMAAMRPRTRSRSYPRRSTWSGGCSSRASSMRRRRPGPPRAEGVRRRKGRCWGRRKPWPANAVAGSPIPPKPGRSCKRGRGCGIPCCRGGCSRSWWCAVRVRPRVRTPGQRKPLPPVEAFFTTDLTLSLDAILAQYRERWAVEITIRDSNAFAGFGHDQCRKRERVVGANTLRLVLAAARTLWFVEHAARTPALDLQRYRPWYRQKVAPSQLDIVWTWREALQAAGVFPIPRFTHDLAEIPQEPENALPLAA